MIHAGTDLKYRITALVSGFTLKNDNFTVVIKNRWGQVKYLITKEDCLVDDNDNFYFVMDNVQSGMYKACLTIEREDTDFADDIQHVVDCQYLVNVGECDCEEIEHVCPTDGMTVAYTRVWTVCIDGYVYLAEEDGTPILDVNGNKIYLKATESNTSAAASIGLSSDQLKELLTQRNDNGTVDTVPEAFDAVNSGTNVPLSSDEDIDNLMSRILG